MPVDAGQLRGAYIVRRYRPRIEGLFALIERWAHPTDRADVFWRSISRDNITTFYGKSRESRVAPSTDDSRIFSWLICESLRRISHTSEASQLSDRRCATDELSGREL